MFGCLLLLATKIRFLEANKSSVVFICLFAVPLFYLADNLFNISGPLLEMLGPQRHSYEQNRNLAGRSKPLGRSIAWYRLSELLDVVGAINVGGYMTELKTAHNGYLGDLYLDGGAVGIVTLLTTMCHCLSVARHARAFIRGSPFGGLGFAFFCMTLLMNVSELNLCPRSLSGMRFLWLE